MHETDGASKLSPEFPTEHLLNKPDNSSESGESKLSVEAIESFFIKNADWIVDDILLSPTITDDEYHRALQDFYNLYQKGVPMMLLTAFARVFDTCTPETQKIVTDTLADEVLLNSQHLDKINYSAAACVLGMAVEGCSADEIEKTLPVLTKLPLTKLAVEDLAPINFVPYYAFSLDEYLELLTKSTSSTIADLMYDERYNFTQLHFTIRRAVLRTLLHDATGKTFEQYLQFLSEQLAVIPQNTLITEKKLIADLIEQQSTFDEIKLVFQAITDPYYVEFSRYLGGSYYQMLISTEGPRLLRLVAQVLVDRPAFRQLPVSLQESIVLAKHHSVQDTSVDEIIDRYTSDSFKDILADKSNRLSELTSILGFIDTPEKFHIANEIYQTLADKESDDIDVLAKDLLPELIELPLGEAKQAIEKITAIYEGNTLPLFAKQFKIFEQLYFATSQLFRETRFYKTLFTNGRAQLSPFLRWLSARIEKNNPAEPASAAVDLIKATFWKDLATISIESADPSLLNFLYRLRNEQQVLDQVRASNFSEMTDDQTKKISALFKKIQIIVSDLVDRKRLQANFDQTKDFLSQYQEIVSLLELSQDQSVTDRIAELYFKDAGYDAIEPIIHRMESVKNEAHQRNVNFAQEHDEIDLREGDLLKVVAEDTAQHVLLGGFKSREFIGSVGGTVDSDMTPFDADFSRLSAADIRLATDTIPLDRVLLKYGRIIFLVRDRGQFGSSSTERKTDDQSVTNKKAKYELIHSRFHGEGHYGVRTGLPSTEVDGIILEESLSKEDTKKLFFQVANNGFYIPVYDMSGKLLFSETDFQQEQINQQKIQSALEAPEFSVEELLVALESSSFLQEIFALSSGVSEGYTLRQHTSMVMQQFEKYFATEFKLDDFTVSDFRLLLALHDIGKSLAAANGEKYLQHGYSKEILLFALGSSGIKPDRVEKLIALVDQDILGEYFKNQVSLERTIKEIKKLAVNLELSPVETLSLLRTYYISDASSYTADASGDSSKDNLGMIFSFTRDDQNKPQVDFSEFYLQSFNELVAQL